MRREDFFLSNRLFISPINLENIHSWGVAAYEKQRTTEGGGLNEGGGRKHTSSKLRCALSVGGKRSSFMKRWLSSSARSVNFHFTQRCNFKCRFCFLNRPTVTGGASSTFVQKRDTYFRGLRMLREHGVEKINFAGGEPFMYPKLLGEMVTHCKRDLDFPVVHITTNARLVREVCVCVCFLYVYFPSRVRTITTDVFPVPNDVRSG